MNNRIIKFRAWDGKSINYSPIFSRDWTNDINTQLNERLAENGTALMQFTGLYDKNGKEIYEGDIVKYLFERVYFIRSVAMGEYDDNEGYRIDKHYGYHFAGTFHPTTVGEYIEVIGNIYENPELLTPNNGTMKLWNSNTMKTINA